MLHDYISGTRLISEPHDADLVRLHAAGRQIAKTLNVAHSSRSGCATLARRSKDATRAIRTVFTQNSLHGTDGRWLVDNYRLILTAEKETRQLAATFREYRAASLDGSPEVQPLPYAVAKAYLSAAVDFFSHDGIAAFLQGFQEVQQLDMGELWALKPALQFLLIERIAACTHGPAGSMAVLITSLRGVGDSEWKDLFESISIVNAILSRDPAGFFAKMDYASRDQYRDIISILAKRSDLSESEVAETAVRLASEATQERRKHVGYWLLDSGLPQLRAAIRYRPSPKQRVRDFVLSWPQSYYLIGVEVLTLILVFTILEGGGALAATVLALFLVILPVTQAAVDFMNNLTGYLLRPRVLPKLDFSHGIPSDCATLVAVPTLLLSEKQVRQLAVDLEIRYLANRDENLYFALVTDGPDSDKEEDDRDRLVDVCVALIKALNDRYGSEGRTPFYLFHRHRTYNPSEGRWMGWERKRGKLLDLNQFMRGGPDSFPVKIGNLSVLQHIRYVLTLDSDTQLPRDAAHRLVGAIAHPLHRAVVDPVTKMVVAGYGILQPRIGISIESASSSRLASIYSGQTGFDIYTRAVSDVYQDIFAEGIFTGKGIYDVDALRDAIEQRFPENALLSHDLIEGAYARVGLVSDIELIDDYPSHFSAYSRRKHRWVRGDWQIMRWLLPRVPNFEGRIIPNPINLISRWKILDNLRRSLFEPATLALLIGGWFWLRGEPLYWTCAVIAMLLTPVYASLFFSLLRAPLRSPFLFAWAKDTAWTFLKGHIVAFLQIVLLLHQSMLSVDAIGRSVLRVFVTKKRLLEWETAAEAENAQRRTVTVDMYLAWSPLLALIIAGLLWLVRPSALPIAAPILALWFIARFLSAWLNRRPRVLRGHLNSRDVEFLRTAAVQTWRYFREYSTADTHWLIPDNVREDGAIAQRLSPTNLGLLMNARIAAVHFGYLTLPEFVESTRQTLETVRKLPKHRGHVLNWHCTKTLRALEPRFVSTVDSGNLVACLWTVKQAALSFASTQPSEEVLQAGLADIREQAAREIESGEAGFWNEELAERKRRMIQWAESGLNPELASELERIAAEADSLAAAMDFRFLFHGRKKVMSVGCDVDTAMVEPASYDLLASESRIASFVAIAKGDIPQEGWFHLGRRHTVFGGQRVLVSWTGTMFEYLMPSLWMKGYRHTIMQDSLEAVVRVQQKFARRKGIPWGISESACAAGPDGEYGYHAFGIPELAMRRPDGDSHVVSPYSTFLALPVDPGAVMRNLRKMEKLEWLGRYGFYEAVDYRGEKPEIIRSWMAHHQGMSLLAVCNLLFNDKMQEYFHADPQVLATELLLHERVPNAIAIEKEATAPPPLVAEAAA
jgi:cyclic beta-1,2-glucan synthetase